MTAESPRLGRPLGTAPAGHEAGRYHRTGWRDDLGLVWVLTRREIRDTLRDWRLVVPIMLLTLVFPVILNIAAGITLSYVRRFNAGAVGEQAIPFLLLVVGFFPISFSLVIALETFVGEKERKSLEPLLATPLTNTQLYLGKSLAAVIPPVGASFMGIIIYFISLVLSIQYRPPFVLGLQVLLLTTAEALVMVSGAVIISSQTTSVRAANLLASFIILPMAFVVQGEALIMFWARYDVLWYVLAALVVLDVMLVRMGIRVFNREELLAREIDSLNLRRAVRLFFAYLRGTPSLQTPARKLVDGSILRRVADSVVALYRGDVVRVLKIYRLPVAVVCLALLAAILLGCVYAFRFPLPVGAIRLEQVGRDVFERYEGSGVLPSLSSWAIFTHNVRSLLVAGFLAVLSFGVLAIVLLMAPIGIIGFAAAQVALAGYNPLVFFGVFILPHGLLELPAAILATAMAVRLGMSVVTPAEGRSIGQSWLEALAQFVKVFVLVVLPLLALAAFVEVNITPELVLAVYGR
jgi:uncharacterized membrane protein SpoIIM required for sporulation